MMIIIASSNSSSQTVRTWYSRSNKRCNFIHHKFYCVWMVNYKNCRCQSKHRREHTFTHATHALTRCIQPIGKMYEKCLLSKHKPPMKSEQFFVWFQFHSPRPNGLSPPLERCLCASANSVVMKIMLHSHELIYETIKFHIDPTILCIYNRSLIKWRIINWMSESLQPSRRITTSAFSA